MLFIEGTDADDNGDLKEGFRLLLEQNLRGNLPRIVMCNSKESTIDTYINTQFPVKRGQSLKRFLLVDLDSKEENIESDLKKNKLSNYKQSSFYMIQEMEAWFLSQPDVLEMYFKQSIKEKLGAMQPTEIENPSDKLRTWTKTNVRKDGYHKVKDGVELLKKLNLEKLMNDFDDVKNLVTELDKA